MRGKIPTATEPEIFGSISWAIAEFASELDTSVSAAAIITFLHIAMHQGVSQKEVCAATGLSKYAVSRACRTLIGYTMIVCSVDGREKRAVLSPRGESFYRRVHAGMREHVRRARQAGMRRLSAR